MQTTIKKTGDKTKHKEKQRQDAQTPRKAKEEDVPKMSVSTPRNFLQKSSTVDIYGQKRKAVAQTTQAPKKVTGVTRTSTNATPTKDYLKSSPSSISQISTKSAYDRTPRVGASKRLDLRSESKTSLNSAMKAPRTARDLPVSNVTVSSPAAKRKLDYIAEQNRLKKETVATASKKPVAKIASKILEKGDSKDIDGRERSKTRTLNENEAKILTLEGVDNNAEMQNLTKRLSAKPKAFYVEIQDKNTKIKELTSDNDDVSYEDDFESYESDFDSYHSDQSAKSSLENDGSRDEQNESDQVDHESQSLDESYGGVAMGNSAKETKDEEKMLDSGNFELRDRSAKSRPTAMEFILEGAEEEKKPSLTDEGFQDMSSSSAVSGTKSHVELLERPLFIDFTKSNECKRKRKLKEKLKQRATDLLSMITLHEMSYNLFEMKPIPYDLYMATFGRSNYTQTAVQTFDDGITEEVQTEDIIIEHKWTQHPIEFSKHDVYLYPDDSEKKNARNDEDYLTKFTFLVNNTEEVEVNNRIYMDKDYIENPLRIYLEQKDGVGSCEILPYATYKNKIKNNDFNAAKLSKFLKKVESRVSNVLSLNSDKSVIQFKNSLNQKIPLSKGYLTISPKSIENKELSFIKNSKISHVIFSETKNNLIMLVHKRSMKAVVDKCVICLWDISVAIREPLKILVAVDNVSIGKFKGNTDGMFVAALEDGSLHLWDLSEKPIWWYDVAIVDKPTDLADVSSKEMTPTESEREWNAKNVEVGNEQTYLSQALQACAYTNSGANMTNGDVIDDVVGLEFVGEGNLTGLDGGRKILGQICMLLRVGILTIWSIIQERTQTLDIGKAYWSKIRLEKMQTINLIDHIDLPTKCTDEDELLTNFNLNAAKRRLCNKKIEKSVLKKLVTRPKSTSSSEFDISRPASAASFKKIMPVEKNVPQSWESGILCYDLKILKVNKKDSYLIAKNCGEVLCCTKVAGAVKVKSFSVTNDTSTVTCLGVSSHGLPYFLAATDSGTVNLCSVVESRVLLTLDCRNEPPPEEKDRCQADHKGRFISSSKTRAHTLQLDTKIDSKLPVTFIHWSPSNPCSLYCLLQGGKLSVWDLTHSDIYAKSVSSQAAVACAAGDGLLALLTPEAEVQVHRMMADAPSHGVQHLELFKKYVVQKTTFTEIRGAIVKEIRQRFTDWITQVVRLYRGEEFVEFEWIVGPIPIGTDLGKEVVSIFRTNVSTGGPFYTDSNARQMMKRTCWNESTAMQPQKKPVSACYYPVVSRICLQSTNTSTGLCVLTDRAQGGTSYNDGEIELMVHRRLLTDDGFGLEETLNEEAYGVPLVVSGKHRIVFGNIRQEVEDLSFWERMSAAARRWLLEPWLFMTSADKVNRRKWQNVRNKRYSALRLHGLPRHIHVLTLEPWKGGSVLLRLENTLEKAVRGRLRNEKSEGPEGFVNKPSHITVQLRQLFMHLKIKQVRETTLAANQWLDDARQMDWSTRYVYQGADDEILPEDAVDYKDVDSKPAKERQEDEKDYKDITTYSEEEEFNRRKTTKARKKQRTKSKSNYDNKYDANFRRKRSVNMTENVLENVINGSFNERFTEKFIKNNLETSNNTIDDQDYVTTTRKYKSKVLTSDRAFVTQRTTVQSAMDITSNVTILPEISLPTYPIPKTTRRPRNFGHRLSKHLKSGRFTTIDLDRPAEIPPSEEDFSMNLKKRSPKRKNAKKNVKNERIVKDSELPRDGPDDGITKSMFEMYYKSPSKPRALKASEVQEVSEGRRKGRRKMKTRRFKDLKSVDEYPGPGGGRSLEGRQSSRREYEDLPPPDGREDREDSGEGVRKRSKMAKRSRKRQTEKPLFVSEGGRPFGSRRRPYDDSAEDAEHIPRMSSSRMRARRQREDPAPEEEAVVEVEDTGYEEQYGARRKRAAEDATEGSTAEATEPAEEPDYAVTLRPTQIRTFVIYFENSFRGTGYNS